MRKKELINAFFGENRILGVKLSNQRYEETKQVVVQMYEKLNVSCIPINCFEIASKMNIKVIPYYAYPKKTQTLLLKKSEDGFNNTIMHEIGHIVLDHTEDSELAEKEVKFFAKFALAPPVLIHKLKLNSPEDISKTFEISYEAACNALSYYYKWLRYGNSQYTDYEEKMLYLFS